MILDTLANAHLYCRLSKRIALALEFLAKPRTTELEPKQSGSKNSLLKPILNDDVYALVQRYRPQLRKDAFWEAHRTYVDVQCMIEGEELMGWAPLQAMGISKAYDAERDYVVLEPLRGGDHHAGQFFLMQSGMFAIFFPGDAHMPGVSPNDAINGEVKKIVVKVRA